MAPIGELIEDHSDLQIDACERPVVASAGRRTELRSRCPDRRCIGMRRARVS
jgi:hypothetical protein